MSPKKQYYAKPYLNAHANQVYCAKRKARFKEVAEACARRSTPFS